MSKELDSVELVRIEFEKELEDDPNNEWLKRRIEGLKMAEQSLLELEAIKEAAPSEALECLDKLEECADGMKDLPMSNWSDLAENGAELDLKIMDWVETIKFELFKSKQALLKAQKLKKALDFFCKHFELDKEAIDGEQHYWLKTKNQDEEYENFYTPLTQQEFDLLKEVL